MKWMSDSGNMKKASLPPSSQSWRNCHGRFSKSKGRCPTPDLYGPVSELLGASISLLKKEDTEATQQGTPCGSTCVTTERT